MARRPLIAGNWKMNLMAEDATALVGDLVRDVLNDPPDADVLICPPFPLIVMMGSHAAGSGIGVGGQDCHAASSGAYTGDTSAALLANLGCSACIVGHSERRDDHNEPSALVAAKAQSAIAAGLTAIICIGETEVERRAGQTLDVVRRQLADSVPASANAENTVIAYEPVWAIGSGLAATPDDVAEVHAAVRGALPEGCDPARTRILYGGSVKPENAAEILALEDVDGALVGGASLKAASFIPIYRAVP